MHLEYEMVFAAIECDRDCKTPHSRFVSTFPIYYFANFDGMCLRIAFLVLAGLSWEGTPGSRIRTLTFVIHSKGRLQMATGLQMPLSRLTLPMQASRLVLPFMVFSS